MIGFYVLSWICGFVGIGFWQSRGSWGSQRQMAATACGGAVLSPEEKPGKRRWTGKERRQKGNPQGNVFSYISSLSAPRN